MNKAKLVIVTTVPETLDTILRNQPAFLSNYFDVRLVSSPDVGRVENIIKHEKVKFYSIPMQRGISLLADFISIWRMFRLLRKIRADIVHSYTPKAGLVTMIAAFFARVPIRVHTFTGLIFPSKQGFMQRVLILIDRLICLCATTIIPEGEGVKKDLLKFRITTKPLNIIGYGNIAGVDTAYFDRNNKEIALAVTRLKGQLNLSDENFLFCFVGRLNKDKGIHELLEAFKLLPETVCLCLVGELDKTAPIYEEDINYIKNCSRIYSLGFQKDIRPALAIADILVLPSYREGFPNVILQAGSMGVPVIATDINGCNEVISNNHNGWLVPIKDIYALKEAMEQAIHLRGTLTNMGDYSREIIINRFQQRDYWEKLKKFYDNLIC